MIKNNIGKIRKLINIFLCIALLMGSIATSEPAKASVCNSQSECDSLLRANQKAASAQKIQLDNAQNAIASLSAQISIMQNNIDLNTQKINLTLKQISDTQAQIAQKTAELKTQKENLYETMVVYYENTNNQSTITTIIGSDSLSSAIDRSKYLESIGSSFNNAITKINQIMADLQTQNKNLVAQQESLQSSKDSLVAQQQNLKVQQQTQSSLLSNAQGTLASLQAQQAAIQARSSQLTQIYSGGGGIPAGSQLVTSVDGSWYYNQTDYPGVYMVPGASLSLYGCLVTSLAMVATKYGHRIDPPGIINASNFTNDGGWAGFNRDIGIQAGSTQPINWDIVNSQLSQGHPVIVGVKLPGVPLYNGTFNHFIVIKGISDGTYLIHDPYWRNKGYQTSDVKAMKIITPE